MADISTTDILVRLLVTAVLAAAIGFEREYRRKPAGVRTNILVGLGTAVMTIASMEVARLSGDPSSVDISRITSQILPGIGFIGAGVILHAQGDVRGLTTAASIWLVAGVAMVAAMGLFPLAFIATGMGLAALIVLRRWHVSEEGEQDKP